MKQRLEVPGAGLHHLVGDDADVIDHEHPLGFELRQVEPHRRDVGDQVVASLLERHEHAGLTELHDPAHEKLHRQQRLATASRAAHQGRTSARQPTLGHLVETHDPRGTLG